MKNTLNKGKAVCFAVHSLILYQYPIDLLTFLELYLESSTSILRENSDLLAPFVKAILF